MKHNTVRRFSAIEIAYHWSQAVPYTVLFCTGVGMLLQRLLGVEILQNNLLSIVHRVAGVVLIVALAQAVLVKQASDRCIIDPARTSYVQKKANVFR